jgi:eukaryotic-like serine/threonine-protein kinase
MEQGTVVRSSEETHGHLYLGYRRARELLLAESVIEKLRSALTGRYEVEREIGRGGMATVYLARDLENDRNVAIKVLNSDLSVAMGPERFRREIDVANTLAHPSILPVYDSGESNGSLYYVMPFVEGESLAARLERERQLSVDEALRITCEVAGAIDYAHKRGIVHRDIKPENILLQDGQVLVADFGIARAITATGDQKLTQTGLALGTPTYMSPEQAMGEKNIDGRSDVYSLGCVLYEMLIGQPPFVGPTAQAIIARQMLDEVPSLTVVRGAIPKSATSTCPSCRRMFSGLMSRCTIPRLCA